MLRVTLDIVPFGDEDQKRPIGTVVIGRRAPGRINPCDYDVRLATDGKDVKQVIVRDHYYEDGAWQLVRRALEVLQEVG